MTLSRVALAVAFLALAPYLWRQFGPPAALVTHEPEDGRAAAFIVIEVDRSDQPFFEDPVSRFSVSPGPRTDDLPLEELLALPNVVPVGLAQPLSLQRILFVEVDDLAKVWAEPFLDRAIPAHAGGRAWSVDLADVERWAAVQPAWPTMWVWNTGRCGSTLVHRVVSQAGVASVSESSWMDQIALAMRPGTPDAVLERLLRASIALDTHVARRLFPSATLFSMNPKAFGIRMLDLVARSYPDHKMMYLYRAVDEVVQSFWGVLPMPGFLRALADIKALKPLLELAKPRPPLMSNEMRGLEAAGSLPAVEHLIAQEFSYMILDGLAQWTEANVSKQRTMVLGYKELATKDERLRRRIVEHLLSWAGDATPKPAHVAAAMEGFLADSQAGSMMSRTTSSASKPRLTTDVVTQIQALSAAVPCAGRADFVAPGSLFAAT